MGYILYVYITSPGERVQFFVWFFTQTHVAYGRYRIFTEQYTYVVRAYAIFAVSQTHVRKMYEWSTRVGTRAK